MKNQHKKEEVKSEGQDKILRQFKDLTSEVHQRSENLNWLNTLKVREEWEIKDLAKKLRDLRGEYSKI